MNFKLKVRFTLFLAIVTALAAIFHVMTPVLLRTLIDGILPSKDISAIYLVLAVMGLSEGFHLLANGILNRELDKHENQKLLEAREWLVRQGLRPQSELADADRFYASLTNDLKRLTYKRVKNPWYRVKDFLVLILLSLISIKISYLAGFLIVAISLLSLALVYLSGESQGRAVKDLARKSDREKAQFELARRRQSGNDHEASIGVLLQEINEVTQAQQKISQARTWGQDVNNGVRFCIMFLILSVGGFLFAKELLSMGSLWALVITMMRITPTLQSILRWILQSKSERGLEERILESLRQKNQFQKPAFYNRLVKIIEKALHHPGQRFVSVAATIELGEIEAALEYWKSFYQKKANVSLVMDSSVTTEKTYLIVGSTQIPKNANIVIFNRREHAPSELELIELT